MTHSINRRTLIAGVATAPVASLPIPAQAEETIVFDDISMTREQRAIYDLGWRDGQTDLINFIEKHAEKTEPDPHPEWLDQWRTEIGMFEAKFTDRDPSKKEDDSHWRAREEIAQKIINTPARTRDGLLAQLDYWLEDWGAIATCGGSDPQPEVTALETIRAGLAGLAG